MFSLLLRRHGGTLAFLIVWQCCSGIKPLLCSALYKDVLWRPAEPASLYLHGIMCVRYKLWLRFCHVWDGVNDLDAGAYLRINQIRAFAPPDVLTHSLTCFSTQHCVHLAGRLLLVQEGWAESCVDLCWDATHSYWSQASLPKVPGQPQHSFPCTSLISRITPWVFAPLRIFFTFFLDLLLLSETMSFSH